MGLSRDLAQEEIFTFLLYHPESYTPFSGTAICSGPFEFALEKRSLLREFLAQIGITCRSPAGYAKLPEPPEWPPRMHSSAPDGIAVQALRPAGWAVSDRIHCSTG